MLYIILKDDEVCGDVHMVKSDVFSQISKMTHGVVRVIAIDPKAYVWREIYKIDIHAGEPQQV